MPSQHFRHLELKEFLSASSDTDTQSVELEYLMVDGKCCVFLFYVFCSLFVNNYYVCVLQFGLVIILSE